MDEKQVIKQLKELNSIKPNKHWVALNKQNLFGEEKQTSWMFIQMGKPALVLSSLALITVAVAGSLLYITPQNSPVAVYENFNALLTKFVSENEANTEAVASLEEIHDKLEEISLTLENIKNIKDPVQALTMAEVIKGTVRRGGEAVERLKDGNGTLSKQVLASLNAIEDISKDLEQRTSELQEEMFISYLEELKQKDLTEEGEEHLSTAENYYKDGMLAEAMIFLLKVEN